MLTMLNRVDKRVNMLCPTTGIRQWSLYYDTRRPTDISPLSPVNLLSFGKVAESHRVIYDSTENQVVVEDEDGLKAEFAALVSTNVFHTEPVHDREGRYTKRQATTRSTQPNESSSTNNMIDMLTTGNVVNATITTHNLRRALDIYGPYLSFLKGKTTQRRGAIVRVEPVCKPSETEQTLHEDVMFGAKESFFIVVAKPLAYTMVSRTGETPPCSARR